MQPLHYSRRATHWSCIGERRHAFQPKQLDTTVAPSIEVTPVVDDLAADDRIVAVSRHFALADVDDHRRDRKTDALDPPPASGAGGGSL